MIAKVALIAGSIFILALLVAGKPSTSEKELREYVDIWNKTYYVEVNTVENRAEAQKVCVDLGMKLVAFEGHLKYLAIINWLAKNDLASETFFTGGIRKAFTSNETWTWYGEDEFVHYHWLPNEPDLSLDIDACLVFSEASGGWSDSGCGADSGLGNIICQY